MDGVATASFGSRFDDFVGSWTFFRATLIEDLEVS